jgi:hypothetical protein
MAKIPSWQDLGRAFEELDEHGYLCLLWKYVPELKQHSFWFEWNSAARFHDRNKYSKAERDLITAKFRAISKTAGIKRGFADPATGWLAVIRAISGNDLLGTGIATDIDTGTAYSAISGRVDEVCKRASQICYEIDFNPEAHAPSDNPAIPEWRAVAPSHDIDPAPETQGPGVLIAAAPHPSAESQQPYPNRATWMAARLKERGWDKNSLYPCGGPDRKTVQKILDGKYVRAEVFKRVIDALNHQKKNGITITLTDIPSN